jgi:hypothetical protein
MSVLDKDIAERKRRQAQFRRERNKAAGHAPERFAEPAATLNGDQKSQQQQQGVLTEQEHGNVETASLPADHREVLWRGYCKFAFNLVRRNSEELKQFEGMFQSGSCSQIGELDPLLMQSALSLVAEMGSAGVRKWDWRPAPTDTDLEDADGWVERRLAEQRSTQDEAAQTRRWGQKLARALGEAPSLGSGAINPAHLQESKHSLDELVRRLEWTIAKHQSERGEFKREFLDPRSPYYIRDDEGGISNKQIIIMSKEITGSHSRRPFDHHWKLVMDHLRERQVEESKKLLADK